MPKRIMIGRDELADVYAMDAFAVAWPTWRGATCFVGWLLGAEVHVVG